MEIRNTFFTSIKSAFKKLSVCFILLPSVSLALPMEFTATYDIEKFGMLVAQSNFSLKHENDGVRITQHTEAAGLLALIRDDALDESSFLSSMDDQLLLTEFSHQQQSPDNKNRNIQLKIDWIQSSDNLLGKVSGTAFGEKIEFNVDKPVWDTNSYQVPLMLNTKEGAKPQQYTMMVKGELRTYTFITHRVETIEVNGNTIETIKIKRDNDTHTNPIFLWLAPSLNNLPVKIEKWKNGDLQLTMSLKQAKFVSDENLKFNTIADNSEELGDL